MRNFVERQELVERVSKLYPHGCTTAKEMAQRFREEGIWEIGMTRVSLLTRDRGKNNFIVGYLATEYIDPRGEIIYDVFEGSRILEHPVVERIQTESGPVTKLGRIDLGNHPNAGLVSGKISPLDIVRLRMRTYKKSRHFFISAQTVTLAEDGVDVILPKNGTEFEVMLLADTLSILKINLKERHWDQVHIV
ncbi:MAG: hypothetical protein Q7R43_04230 [Candidatus Daviesbacteria bacterium]|nr:hypothetical protein [Candidatus Daviesbacteria bacterium]